MDESPSIWGQCTTPPPHPLLPPTPHPTDPEPPRNIFYILQICVFIKAKIYKFVKYTIIEIVQIPSILLSNVVKNSTVSNFKAIHS